ncbi:alpha/beta-hydrolase [Polychaeton citri CBS 116435]|uniref:Alpha/beta-hydrolase n=1 Tax=Polychaeton citri CBS 116435 TaxID=1314669 RepID=A0A9P4QAN0_9PEZI|nr:alpha/beta-hydrolase [Polychaeton citri CBS 116435]
MPFVLTSCTALLITPFAWKKLTYRPELLPPPPKDYHYRLDHANDSSSLLTLPDGRKIGYAQYGVPNGKPIITLHGILGSRLENALFDANARDLGARIIGIERPGIGWSSPDPRQLGERRVLDHARDVEALAEHLHLEEYAIIGISGGGPYALACAHDLPSSASKPSLKAVSVVTGLGLPDMSQAWPPIVVFLNKNLNLRWLIKWVFASSPAWNLKLSDEDRMEEMRKRFDVKKAHPADVETARNPDHPDWMRLFLRSTREAVSQGWGGFLDDSAILSADPGFCVEDIRADLPVQLWYGTDDTNVSPKAGDETAQRLRAGGNTKVELHMQHGETHGSTQVKYQRRILEDVLKAMDT